MATAVGIGSRSVTALRGFLRRPRVRGLAGFLRSGRDMLARTILALFLVVSTTACGATRSGDVAPPPAVPATPARSVAVSPDGAIASASRSAESEPRRTCAARVGSGPGQGWFPYAYGALSREMARLRERGGRAFDVRRVLDRIADAFETLPDGEQLGTQAAAAAVREQVSQLIESSAGQDGDARATRRALEETHAVLRRMADGPCRGDAALRYRITQLGEAVEAIPDDPAEQRISLVPVVTALQRTQAAFLALSTSYGHRTWTTPQQTAAPPPPTDGEPLTASER